MKKILFIGTLNSPLNRDIVRFFKTRFDIQFFNDKPADFDALLEVCELDLIFVTLVGMDNNLRDLLYHIKNKYPYLSVLTLGADYETARINDLYQDSNIENIHRPATDEEILDRCLDVIQNGNNPASVISHDSELYTSGTKCILLVDDNQMVLRNIKSILEKHYEIAMAASGAQALMVLGKRKVDLILLDYDMPVMDGNEVFKIIKADPNLSSIPVIFLSGVSNPKKVFDVLSSKPEGYILKPPSASDLLSRIESVIGR